MILQDKECLPCNINNIIIDNVFIHESKKLFPKAPFDAHLRFYEHVPQRQGRACFCIGLKNNLECFWMNFVLKA